MSTKSNVKSGLYRKSSKTPIQIILGDIDYPQNGEEIQNRENTQLLYLLVTHKSGEGSAVQFSEEHKFKETSEATSGYDPGNTGHGYDTFVTEVVMKNVTEPNLVALNNTGLGEYTEILEENGPIEIVWKAMDYPLLVKYTKQGGESEVAGFTPDLAGSYKRVVDKRCSGEDYNDDTTIIKVNKDGSATYSWDHRRQGGHSMPTFSSDRKEGKVTFVQRSTKCQMKVTLHPPCPTKGSKFPWIELETPPCLTLGFLWNNGGTSHGIDLSLYTKTKTHNRKRQKKNTITNNKKKKTHTHTHNII